MAITTASQSQIGQETAKNSQIVTTSVKLVNSGASTGPSISSIVVTDSGYNTLDDTAAATSNSYIRILGTGFTSTANVFLNGTMVPKANVTFTSSTELRATLPVSNTGNYAVGVFNSNSAGALYSSSFVISTMPQWLTSATLANVAVNTQFSNTLSATSDSSVTYSNTTILPTGVILLSNGYYYGTITSNNTYSFDVKATDAENQDSTRTFSLTALQSYRYFRVTLNSVNGGGAQAQLTELSFRDSGGNYITQTLSSPVSPSAGSLTNLNNQNAPYSDDTNMNPLPFVVNYDMESKKIPGTDVKFLRIGSSDDSPRYVSNVTVSASNDNSNFTEIISGTPPSYAGIRVLQNWAIA